MTHLSDFSFLQRVVSISYLTLWYIYRVCQLDRFQCFSPSRIRKGELKSIVSLLILIMLPFQLTYAFVLDVASSTVKYEEGYIQHNGQYVTKPEMLWSQANKDYVVPTDYSLCIGFSLQTSTLLLLQCFWNYLANLVAGAKFMSSKEFKCYIVCVDGLTGKQMLNGNKLTADFLISNINVASIVVWVIVILIFHPAPENPLLNNSPRITT
ncbi:hypothetical protein F4703DRAFT_1914941 [Phycomyces blakesleeanus]|uniref:Uncharacterized protein n=1 Tax=Phycomyces blakesleeanus (strain ATCC 8743b / DSM 1359 / FGSC 10004 / NBRC 33097 / NRRL 1555) TaxID=763407 RepID=A0A167NLV4_PHYB8|nr:hypothetical protein PHYBLDRAFT_166204 [Phycomyces blakesleeanus NRRL 1555(-)]OAD76230.1 hypothetical protein PHYBLDRAFT_166204 [Phycomyces blakesleeanus NRRL 1555(-)]|eukprot:XP_018294270.1 hypothetical protein PHYBLDRAFT_166204 [Phycomyces blakesleeanus NRRL 1555(-)]